MPGDIVFREGDFNDSSVYAVISGKVEIFHSNINGVLYSRGVSRDAKQPKQTRRSSFSVVAGSKHVSAWEFEDEEDYLEKRLLAPKEITLGMLKSEDYFGEVSFFTDLPHSASARCKEFCTIVKISRAKFLQLLRETNSEEDFEMMCMLRDEVVFKNNYKSINTRCWSCNQFGHLAKSCKSIHFYPLKSHIIQVLLSLQQQFSFSISSSSSSPQLVKVIELSAAERLHY